MVYHIECQNEDNLIYFGETEKPIKIRISQHLGYIRNTVFNQLIGYHTKGHSQADMKTTVLEQ